jgi:hypothetical protein
MRILKYLFLILLLFTIGLVVYVFTQKGNYQISSVQIIKASKSTVFDYVNDYKNWETFSAMHQNDPTISFEYRATTSGKGASYSWQGDASHGKMKTLYAKENDSLAQKMTSDGINGMVYWKFTDTIGGTKVTYSAKGTINFVMKFQSLLRGGITRLMTNEYEKTLYNLNKTLDFELKTYRVKVNGVVQRDACFFIKQTFTCKMKSLSRNIKVVMPKLVYFFKKNNIPMAGKPFVIYETTTLETDIVTVSVCIPTKQLVSLLDGSDVSSGQMEAFTCIKTTLQGDYSHRDELWKKAQHYVLDKKYNPNFAGKYVEIFTKTIDDIKNPSKWETALYIPVYPKAEDAVPAATPTTAQGVNNTIPTSVAVPSPAAERVTGTPKPTATLPKAPTQNTVVKQPVLKKNDTVKKTVVEPTKPKPKDTAPVEEEN